MDIQKELSDDERQVVAARLLDEQRDRFDGVRKAAYIAAGVNPATWARVTGGERVRPDRLVLIVKSLWPESLGRWELVPNKVESPSWSAVPDYIERGPWTDEVDNAMADVDGRFIALEGRVRALERQMSTLMADETEGGGEDDVSRQRTTSGTPVTTPADEPTSALSVVDDDLPAAAKGGVVEEPGENSI